MVPQRHPLTTLDEARKPPAEPTADQAPTPGQPSSDAPRWQFSIRSLLIAMLAVSLSMAVIVPLSAVNLRAFAVGGAMLAVAGGVLIANSMGWLARCQSPRSRPRWLATGWLMFAVSLSCPAAKGCNNKSIYGIEFATGIAVTQGEYIHRLAVVHEARVEAWDTFKTQPQSTIGFAFLYTTTNAANFIALFSPLLWLRWRQRRWEGLRWIVLAGLCVSLSFSWDNTGGLRVGYYLWCGSFLVLANLWKLSWRDQAKLWLACACFAGIFFLPSLFRSD